MNPSDPLSFKFRWMDGGSVSGYAGLAGKFNGTKLVLDEAEFPIDAIFYSSVDENVLTLMVLDGSEVREVEFVISGEKASRVKSAIDAGRSRFDVAQEQKQLIEEGQGESFRSEVCPHCDASISLSRFADSPQCYCTFCDTLFTIEERFGGSDLGQSLPRTTESKYRICEQCEMYSHPRKFTIFYFIFLVYFIHFDSRQTFCCPACMRWESWKMFLGNIFGLLGLPFACRQLWRSYRSRIAPGPLRGLDDANSLARRGKVERALDRYDVLMDNLPINAGIKFNIGSGLLIKGDVAHAEAMFMMSLEDCSNYPPSLNGLRFCYQSAGKVKKLEQLEYQMKLDEVDYYDVDAE